MPLGEQFKTTDPLSEALHIGILVKVLNGDKRTENLYTKEEAMEILDKKLSTYESF